MYENLVGARCC